jgi:hypothetical protein
MPCGDTALRAKTGRDWAAWHALLDRADARELAHREIAHLLATRHGVASWWSQMITVGYERHIGRRAERQRCDGGYNASASKTLSLEAAAAHALFVDASRRRGWLQEPMTLRTATAPRSARFGGADGTLVAVWITAKGPGKCTVVVQHEKLADAAAVRISKRFWKDALQRLAEHAG